MTDWRSDDPRDTIDRGTIIVWARGDYRCFVANVDTKHTWSVFLLNTPPDYRRYVGPDESWPDQFVWITA